MFAQLAAEGADASRIIDMAVSRWLDIDAVLSPIIGRPGVAALFERSIHLACANHPCLAPVHQGAFEPGDFGPLRQALAQASSADADAANDALLGTFQTLLTNLIGGPLAERLLGNVWNRPSGAQTAQGAGS
ncbi:hypothetical protein ACFPME_02900 [Rhodanobacter umsongensis]|uniref:Uncharacterized protein n=1 Tax=Rhodanobacter umsongensis TaxID=633153 RepID=A0ABW0JI90_9GAMM